MCKGKKAVLMRLKRKWKAGKFMIAVTAAVLLLLMPGQCSTSAAAQTETGDYTAGGSSVAEQAELSAARELLVDDIVKNPVVFEEKSRSDGDTSMDGRTGPVDGEDPDPESVKQTGTVQDDPEDPRNRVASGAEAETTNGLITYIVSDDTYEGYDSVFGERMLCLYTCGMKCVADVPEDTDDGTIHFYTSDRAVAEVTKLGRVLAMTPGECVMTAILSDGSIHTMKVVVSDKPETNRQIALTFDDGPCWLADQLLDFLDEMNIKVTFFYEGINIRDNKERAARAYNSGYEIGNHSWDHLELTKLTAEQIQEEVEKCQEAICDVTGAYPTILRPPYGSYNQTVRDNVGLPMITWNVDPEDWKYLDAEKVAKDLLEGAQDGNIILIHEIHPSTVTGIQPAIRQLIEDGVEFLTVTELLTRNGVELQPGSVYWKADRDPR